MFFRFLQKLRFGPLAILHPENNFPFTSKGRPDAIHIALDLPRHDEDLTLRRYDRLAVCVPLAFPLPLRLCLVLRLLQCIYTIHQHFNIVSGGSRPETPGTQYTSP